MNYTSELIEQLVTSPAALRALDYVSPVYANASTILKVLNAIGEETDELVGWIERISKEMIPAECTWALPYWEMEYGIIPGVGTVAERRKRISKRVSEKLPSNPARLRVLAEQISGGPARLDDDIEDKTIRIYLSSAYDANIKKTVEDEVGRRKPAHLTLEIDFEQSVSASVALVGYFAYGRKFTMGQVN